MTDPMSTPLSRIIAVSNVVAGARRGHPDEEPLESIRRAKRRAVMTRIEPSAKLPLHRNDGDEPVFVVGGGVVDEFDTVTSGNVSYRPNGCVHTVSSPNGAALLAILTGSVTPGCPSASALDPGHRGERTAADRRAIRRPPEAHLGRQGDRTAVSTVPLDEEQVNSITPSLRCNAAKII
jgi:hypothetical protein